MYCAMCGNYHEPTTAGCPSPAAASGVPDRAAETPHQAEPCCARAGAAEVLLRVTADHLRQRPGLHQLPERVRLLDAIDEHLQRTTAGGDRPRHTGAGGL